MSRVGSPPATGRGPGLTFPSVFSPTTSNIIAARKSVSPPQRPEFTMRGVVNEPIYTPINFAVNQESSEEDDSSSADEITPLVTSPVSSDMGENGASKIKRRSNGQNTLELPESVRCDCHEPPKPADKGARNRLIAACIVVLLFMIGEIIGNYKGIMHIVTVVQGIYHLLYSAIHFYL